MPHLELSLIGLVSPEELPTPRQAPESEPTTDPAIPRALTRWAAAAAAAEEPCMVLAVDSAIVAVSAAGAEMIGLGDGASATGRRLRDAVVDLVDFTDSLDRLDRAETDKIPPLLAISSGRLARGLMRVACRESKTVCTMDAVATPLWDAGAVAGSLTFFSRI